MKRRKMFLAAGAAASNLAVGCGSKATLNVERDPAPADDLVSAAPSIDGAAIPQRKQSDKKVWPVGVYLSLTGADASFGKSALQGIELAVAEINAAGVQGAPLELIVVDNQSNPNLVTKLVTKLTTDDKVIALLGDVASSRSIAGAIVATQKRIPMITPASTNSEVTKGRSFAFRVCFIDEAQGPAAADFVVKVLKKKKIGLAYAEDDLYSVGLAEEFKKAIAALGGSLVAQAKFTIAETRFGSYVKELKAAKPDIIYAPIYYPQMIQLARAAKAERLPGDMFVGGDGWAGEQKLLDELEGAYYTDHWAVDLPTAASRQFVTSFRAKHETTPNSLAAVGYDSVLVLADAMKRAASMTGPALRDAIAATKNVSGVTGSISINAENNPDKPIIVAQIRDQSARYASAVGPGSDAILAAAKKGP